MSLLLCDKTLIWINLVFNYRRRLKNDVFFKNVFDIENISKNANTNTQTYTHTHTHTHTHTTHTTHTHTHTQRNTPPSLNNRIPSVSQSVSPQSMKHWPLLNLSL